MFQQQLYYSLFLHIEGVAAKLSAIGEVFFLLLKYFASSLPAGPGMKISKILLSIISIDYYSQKKITFIITA